MAAYARQISTGCSELSLALRCAAADVARAEGRNEGQARRKGNACRHATLSSPILRTIGNRNLHVAACTSRRLQAIKALERNFDDYDCFPLPRCVPFAHLAAAADPCGTARDYSECSRRCY
jgi:hypothetical protein